MSYTIYPGPTQPVKFGGGYTGDPYLDISRGLFSGVSNVNKFGRNTDVDALEDIWDGGGTWVAPTTARTHQIVSTNAGDTSAGAGARTIQVYGLTGWGTTEVSEVITMNGTTDVPTVNDYVIIHRMKVITKGASNVNLGVITATADTDGTVTAQVAIGEGQTQMAVYGIPSTQTAYITRFYGSILRITAAAGNLALRFNPEPDSELVNFQVKHTLGIAQAGSTAVQHLYAPDNKFAGPGIFKMQLEPSTVNVDCSAGFDLVLVDN